MTARIESNRPGRKRKGRKSRRTGGDRKGIYSVVGCERGKMKTQEMKMKRSECRKKNRASEFVCLFPPLCLFKH